MKKTKRKKVSRGTKKSTKKRVVKKKATGKKVTKKKTVKRTTKKKVTKKRTTKKKQQAKKVTMKLPEKLGDVTKKEAKELINNYLEDIKGHLKKGFNVTISGIGTFKIKKIAAKPARWGINPFTQERQKFKAKKASKKVKFTPAKALKEAVKRSK